MSLAQGALGVLKGVWSSSDVLSNFNLFFFHLRVKVVIFYRIWAKKMAVSFNETCGYRIGFWQVFLCWRSWSIKFSRSVPILGVESITQPLSMVVQCLLLYCALCQECLILKTISFLFIYTNMKINIIKKKSHLDFWPVSLY